MPMHDPIPAAIAEADGPAPSSAASAPNRISPARLRDWVRGARPRARVVYARGSFVDQHAPKELARLVRELHDAGWLRMHLSRPAPGEPIDYIAVRTDKPVLSGSVI